jgi:hypothetical protein
MTIDQLRGAYRAKPFKPFTIHMGDGRSFRIDHPDFVSHSPAGRTVIVYERDDSFHILDLLLMTEIEIHGSPAQEGGAAA